MKVGTLLWLDDIRDPLEDNWLVFSPITPTEVVWVKSYQAFVDWIIENGLPEAICFDHDLGMEVALAARAKGVSKRKSRLLKQEEKTGYDCAKWLVEYCMKKGVKHPPYMVHSMNPVGKLNIESYIESYNKTV